ncbi:NUDIX domain-containing protein [Candidatus Woesebacteria bacterium]|nr:NUDIX domain-containing protein [Candidatus Woesebacteria bacterium]MCD8507549.1 NUDIX domain-containing protein [Candidatus Woesebacteria bacterium]MCD8527390.1 NUDIX domain-containing protein [Candidatus Woesebacteria bacterium]MCD8546137.1 NUDIX domain-containing protein [Candidatus Woesebacteria bacterium]
MSKHQPIGTCAVLTNSKNEILLGKRKNSYKAGFYGLPGGRIELNEKVTNAISREVMEETGLTGLDFTFLGIVRENQDAYDFVHFVFQAEVHDQEVTLCEPGKCEGWEWFDPAHLQEVLPGHAAAVKLFFEGVQFIDLTK